MSSTWTFNLPGILPKTTFANVLLRNNYHHHNRNIQY